MKHSLHIYIAVILLLGVFIINAEIADNDRVAVKSENVPYDECQPEGQACVADYLYTVCEDFDGDKKLEKRQTVCLYGCSDSGCYMEPQEVEKEPTQQQPTPVQGDGSAIDKLNRVGHSRGISPHPAQVQVVDKSQTTDQFNFTYGTCEGESLATIQWEENRGLCRRDRIDDITRGLVTAGKCCQIKGNSKAQCAVYGERVEPQGPTSDFVEVECYTS